MTRPDMNHFLLFSLLSIFSFGALASADAAVPVFPGASAVESEARQVARYRLVLSELKHLQGQTFGENERRIAGQLERRVYHLPSGVSLQEVMDFFSHSLSNQHTLYRCLGIDCGSSHFWANDVFGRARLVSRDKDQAYLVTFAPGKPNRVTVVYISLRGGRQAQVLVDTLDTEAAMMPEAALQADIRAKLAVSAGWLPGFVVSPDGLDADATAPLISELTDLSAGTRSRLHLIVHCYEGARIEDTLACSDALTEQLRSALGKEFFVKSGGALVPAPDDFSKTGLRFIFWPGR